MAAPQITIEEYNNGYDKTYAANYNDAIRNNSIVLLDKANKLLVRLNAVGVPLVYTRDGKIITSGWRPPGVNASTPGAAIHSNHMTGQAVDLYDPHGEIDDWIFHNQDYLIAIGLWMEHPASTKGWSHVQCVPPKSGNRCFYP